MNSSATTSTFDPLAVKNPGSEPDVLWTSKEVAQFLRVSLKTVFNLRKRGLPYVQLGGAVRFDQQKIHEYLSQNRGLSSHRQRRMIRTGVRS